MAKSEIKDAKIGFIEEIRNFQERNMSILVTFHRMVREKWNLHNSLDFDLCCGQVKL